MSEPTRASSWVELVHLATNHLARGDHIDATTAADEAVAIATPPDLAESLLVRAQARRSGGDVDGADEDAEAALQQAVRMGQPEVVVAAALLLGVAHREQGDYHASRIALLDGVAAARRLGPAYATDLAVLLNDLGVTGKFGGFFEEAASAYDEALGLLTTAFGAEHPVLATVWHNIAGLAHARGHMRAAEEPARRALRIRRSALGPTHPAVAVEQAALAPILEGLGRLDEAERLLQEARAVFDAEGWLEDLASVLHNLGAIAHRRGDLSAAALHYEQSIALKEAHFGHRHPDVARTRANLGVVRWDAGDHQAARVLLATAVEELTPSVAEHHPTLVSTRALLGRLLAELGRDREAADLALPATGARSDLSATINHR